MLIDAPWCGWCKKLAPEGTSAAELLLRDKSPVRLAKVDASEVAELRRKFGIKFFPTLKLFSRDRPQPILYESRIHRAGALAAWATKKVGRPAIRVETVTEAENFIANNRVVAIGFFAVSHGKRRSLAEQQKTLCLFCHYIL